LYCFTTVGDEVILLRRAKDGLEALIPEQYKERYATGNPYTHQTQETALTNPA